MTPSSAVTHRAGRWLHGYAGSGSEPRSANWGHWFGLSEVDSVSDLVRRAAKRSSESHTWKRRAREIETSFGLKTRREA
jgi:hypothetical protein